MKRTLFVFFFFASPMIINCGNHSRDENQPVRSSIGNPNHSPTEPSIDSPNGNPPEDLPGQHWLSLGDGYAHDPGRMVVFGYKKNFDFGNPNRDVEKDWIYGSYRKLNWSHTDYIRKVPLPDEKSTTILQAFNMPYQAIEEQMESITASGYTHIQISPPQKSLENYGVWWELYQPLDFTVLNNRLGNRQQLRSLLKTAHDYGLKVIIDVVLNHMADPARVSGNQGRLYYPKSEGKDGEFLFKPEHFHYGEIYEEHRQFFAKIVQELESTGIDIRNPVTGKLTDEFEDLLRQEEIRYYYAEERLLVKEMKSFYEGQKVSFWFDDDFANQVGQIQLQALEMAFLNERLPDVMKGFRSGMESRYGHHAQEVIQWLNQNPLQDPYAVTLSLDAQGAFKEWYKSYFGQGALIIKEFFYGLQHGEQAPLFINEWDDLSQVWHKWYPGLPSLRKGIDDSPADRYVLEVHAQFFADLIRIGADGFRFDAVKHIPFDYTAAVINRTQDILKLELDTSVDGVRLSDKEFYLYGEIATSKQEIANHYRKQMAVTDFFFLDTIIKHTCLSSAPNCDRNASLQNLRKSNLELNSNPNAKDWTQMIVPLTQGAKPSVFHLTRPLTLDHPDRLSQNEYRPTISFARIHDSVVGFMYKINNYTQSLIANAYVLAAAPGDVLIYGSDFDLERNAGPDYKEPIVLAGIRFRHLMQNESYTDQWEPASYCPSCQRDDLLFIDRGNKGLAIINNASKAIFLDQVKFVNLQPGCYQEILSQKVFQVDENRQPSNSTIPGQIHLPASTAAFIVPSTTCS